MSADLLDIVRAILSQPTAPFHEGAVRGEIIRQCAVCPNVTVEHDEFGNLIVAYLRGVNPPRFAFAAHMDHPGYVGNEFLGGVPEEHRAQNPPTRDFGGFSMWDLPAYDLRNGRIFSRACDDLIGCAVIVAMLRELERTGAECSVYGLFTRAEEVGFVGAIHLAKSGRLPPSMIIVSLETSSETAGACRMGDGVIVRVGDKTSIFDAAATGALIQIARDRGIPHQRALMAGGTCESTAYQLYGFRSAGLCVALGNYHNAAPGNRIEPEFVALADVEAMAALCVGAAMADDNLLDPNAALRQRLETQMEKYRALF